VDKHQWPLWCLALYAHIGERELEPGDNAHILNFFNVVKAFDAAKDEIPWCAGGLGASLERVGIGSTRSLMAKSYLNWGKPLDAPRVGAITVFDRPPDPSLGHVAFALSWDDDYVECLGANQGNGVSIAKLDRSLVRAFRWPSTDARLSPVFDIALKQTLGIEGGFTDDPDDAGGPTNLGITLNTLARWRGGATTAQLKQLTSAEARAIYLSWYWFQSWADQLPPPLAIVHFDCAVNQGVGDAARFLQEALVGLDVDGEIGPKTLGAAQMADARETILEYAAIRESDYRQLSTFWKYGNGWLRRNAEARDLALSLISALISPVTKEPPAPVQPAAPAPQPQQEQPIMTETKQPTKPALNSMTLWGTVLTVVSTVLPVVAQAYGIPLTPDMVTGLGQEAATTLQALLGLLGSGMAIYGRVRADKPLSLT
jgi:uncharacterized protein (TIGR02594 family)